MVAVLAVEHRIAHFVLELLPKTPLAVVSAVEAFLGIETLGWSVYFIVFEKYRI